MIKKEDNLISEENHTKEGGNKIKPNINEEYVKKIILLRKKIAISFVTLAIILLLVATIFIYGDNKNQKNIQQKKLIKVKIEELKNKSSDIKSRIYDVQKYKEVWLNASKDKKDFSPRKISDINNIFNKLVKKYNITSQKISISAPKIIRGGIYNKEHLNVTMINFKISFKSLTDIDSINLINEFFNDLRGYKIIEELDVKKDKKGFLENKKLIEISRGDIRSLISTDIDFHWYFLQEPQANEDQEVKND